MKRLIKSTIYCIIVIVLCVNFAACSLYSTAVSTSSSEEAAATYTIQYADDEGTHTITVTNGQSYSIESIPERFGYTFLGLYDAKVGGTQYVDANGLSVSAYTDKANITLYPQYQAKNYILVLDYGDAAVTASRQYTVSYGEDLPDLPTDLTISHKVFSGWYTEENSGGTKVADAYGNIPAVSVVNEDNFDITDATKYIYLYAGFTTELCTVTLNYGSDIPSETMEIEYGSYLSGVVTSTRNSDGFAVIAWSMSNGGVEYTAAVTGNIILYALEWAPVITFATNGGDSIDPVVARAGTAITLPAATRQSYGFVYWTDADGSEVALTTMPSLSMTLYAVWSVFDGGSGKQTDPYLISTAEQFTAIPGYDADGVYFAITADIDFSCSLTPLTTIYGVLDGQNHTLSNFTMSSDETYVGLFKTIEGTVSNLIISSATITVTRDYDVYTGALTGVNNGTIDNCKVKSSSVSGNATETTAQSTAHARYAVVGGMVGRNSGTMKNCSITTSTVYGDSWRYDGDSIGGSDDIAVAYVGGLIGELATGGYVTGCSVTEMTSITGHGYFQFYSSSTKNPYIKVAVGGVIGVVRSGAVYSDCTSDMTDSSSILSATYNRWNSHSSGGSNVTNCKTYTGAIYGINDG